MASRVPLGWSQETDKWIERVIEAGPAGIN
jgi:hypothetical protein